MRNRSAFRRWAVCLFASACLPTLAFAQASVAPASTASEPTAKIWLDNHKELEDYLKTAKVIKLEEIGLGVTKPRRATLAPGGPIDRMAWKTIRPGIHGGFWESYKSEIAAYELDKLLGLGMIPPTVERQVNGDSGAAVMWAAPTKSFKDLGGPPSPPPAHLERWNRQLIRAKMFDNLIYNKDPNLGNWLVDPAWNLILIDHTRSFTNGTKMAHEMFRIDAELWERMKALTEETLTATLKDWLSKGDIREILKRRDKMAEIIAQMVKDKGEAAVFVRD
jgi:hypothetical protein